MLTFRPRGFDHMHAVSCWFNTLSLKTSRGDNIVKSTAAAAKPETTCIVRLSAAGDIGDIGDIGPRDKICCWNGV